MLYFCSVNDIKGVLVSAPRFDDEYDRMRKAVTEDMNVYMRRTLHYDTNIVEVFDTYNVEQGSSFSVWLEKKRIDIGSVAVNYNNRRAFEADNVIPTDSVMVDRDKGKVTMYAVTRPGRGTLRVVYSGGYPAKVIGQTTTDVMDCPERLYQAALAECVYRLNKLLNINIGDSNDTDGKKNSPQRKLVGGLLWDTAMAMTEFRRPLGSI